MSFDCTHTAERLPWLLNGTLDALEERQVRDHLATCPACRDELRDTRQAWDLHAGHIPAEALVDYALGKVADPARQQLVSQHLEACSRCRAELDLITTDEP